VYHSASGKTLSKPIKIHKSSSDSDLIYSHRIGRFDMEVTKIDHVFACLLYFFFFCASFFSVFIYLWFLLVCFFNV